MSLSETVKRSAQELGFDLVGICDAGPALSWEAYRAWLERGSHGTMAYLARHLEPKRGAESLLPGAKSVIAVGLNYHQPNPHRASHPHIASYALGRDYHKVLRGKLRKLQGELAQLRSNATFRICVDSAPVLEREYAHRAGLGWFGKSTMLINSRRGSWFVIGLLLTDLEIEEDEPATGGCGTCTACIDACPTGCIVFADERWQVDARNCVSYLTIEHKGPISEGLRQKLGSWTFGCDVCQEVCPFNQPRANQPDRANSTTVPDFLRTRDWPGLKEVNLLTPEEWDRLTQGSPVRRATLQGFQRNAAVNRENEA